MAKPAAPPKAEPLSELEEIQLGINRTTDDVSGEIKFGSDLLLLSSFHLVWHRLVDRIGLRKEGERDIIGGIGAIPS